ncbi:hypothetical protein AAVH_12322 [Aphelenchoides avenae]|nr:hypothetical protein AAVH_12322 [Aphelenchus avenae]
MPTASATRSTAVRVSEVWNHFTKESPTLVRCKRCPKIFQRGTYACTTPFWQHLMYGHEDVYETTNYYMKGVAVGNMRRTKRKSPNGEHSASASQAASESVDNQDMPDAEVLDVATDDVAQVVATEDAADGSTDASAPNEMEPGDIGAPEPVATPQFPLDVMLRLQDQLMRQVMSLSQPIPIRVPPAHAPEDDLVETSGRVMLLRLRKLYEKDVKLFLRAANDISNAIFKYEVAE